LTEYQLIEAYEDNNLQCVSSAVKLVVTVTMKLLYLYCDYF